MSKLVIKPEELGKEIANMISAYTEDVAVAIENEVDITAKDVRDEIEQTAPKNTGKYAKGFAIKKDNSNGKSNRIIYNKAKPSIGHLLELGHIKKGGKGRVKARPHMQPAYDKIVPKFEKNVDEIIRNGGK